MGGVHDHWRLEVSEDAHNSRLMQSAFAAMAVAIATLFTFTTFPPLKSLDEKLRDLFHVAFYPKAPVSEDIILITVTEDTLATMAYRSPVDRDFFASLVAALAAHNPKGIALDFLFDQPTEAAKDENLRAALNGAEILISSAYARVDEGLTEKQAAYLNAFTSTSVRGSAVLMADGNDDVVRTVGAPLETSSGLVHPLGASLLSPDGVTESGEVTIAFQFPPDLTKDRFAKYPAHTAAYLPPDWIAGKYVLIGGDIPTEDRFLTPLNAVIGGQSRMPGVEIHAHYLQQLLDGRNLNRQPFWLDVGFTLFMAVGSLLIFRSTLRVPQKVIGLCILVALGWGASALLVNQLGAITAIASPAAAAILTAGAVMGQQWRAERAQRLFIRSTFSRFVSPAVVDQLIDDPERIGRKPELRGVTCIFTDVAGFTTFIESNRDDTDLIEKVLNKYLSGMTDLYFEHGATIDKFIGDAVVGFFGGPLPADDHAERALNLSVELDKFSEAFRRQVWEEFQITFGETRIGIHTGEVLLGNFGSDKFFDYTAIGDTMNTAARLESANKTFGTRTCFSDATLAQATTPVPHRPIGDVRLKGKEEFLRVYELLSSSDVAQPDEYAAAFSLIEAAGPTSIACFENLQTKYPNDQLIAFHLDRLRSGENGTQVRMTSK